jgi:hypothetical protein
MNRSMIQKFKKTYSISEMLSTSEMEELNEVADRKVDEMFRNKIVTSPESVVSDTKVGLLMEAMVAKVIGGKINSHQEHNFKDWNTYAYDVVGPNSELIEVKAFKGFGKYIRFNTNYSSERKKATTGSYPVKAVNLSTFEKNSHRLDNLVFCTISGDTFYVNYLIDSKSFNRYVMTTDYNDPRFSKLPTNGYNNVRAIKEGNCIQFR